MLYLCCAALTQRKKNKFIMATLKAVVISAKMRSDKTWKVFIRLTHGRKSRFIGTEMYVTRKQLTSSFNIKDAQVRMRCDELVAAYRRKIAELGLEYRDMDVDAVLKAITRHKAEGNGVSFSDYFEKWRTAHGNLRGLVNYETSIRALCAFFGRHEIMASEITSRKMQEFAESLSDRPRAASLYCSSIVRVFNDMKDELNDEDTDVFVIKHSLRKFHVPRQAEAEQRGLDVETIRRIFSLPYHGKTKNGHALPLHDLALDCFKLSFCLMGMNAVDLYNAEKFDGDNIIYNRTKTKMRRADRAEMVVKVDERVRKIFDRYRGNKKVFSFSERYATASNFTRALNKGLKDVGKEVGVDGLQFYAARHSVATIAYNDVGIAMSVVDEMLCHKGMDMRVTKLYIKKDFSHVNDANKRLLDFVFGKE